MSRLKIKDLLVQCEHIGTYLLTAYTVDTQSIHGSTHLILQVLTIQLRDFHCATSLSSTATVTAAFL